jgi:hypothetical protein
VSVSVGDHRLRAPGRVEHLDRLDRWTRNAQAVLLNPGAFPDLPIRTALVPLRAKKNRWTVKVQVLLDPDSLALLSSAGARQGKWEVGVLVADSRGKREWEMLGISKVRRKGKGPTDKFILHERTLRKLPPNRYEVRAFVRDGWANLYGGAEAELDLPATKKPAAAGPLLRTEQRHVLTSLPMWNKPRKRDSVTRNSTVSTGIVPAADRSVIAGETLDFSTWICPGKSGGSRLDLQIYLSDGISTLFEFDETRIDSVGECWMVNDRLDTALMIEGRYTYHVLWSPGTGERIFERTRPFVVVPPPAPVPGQTSHRTGEAVMADDRDPSSAAASR